MEQEPTEPRPPAAIEDADREAVITTLQRAVGDGQLNLEEFTARVDTALVASNADQLASATAGIDTAPAASTAPASTAAASSSVVAVLGDRKQTGRWRLPRKLRVFGILGDVHLDLREVVVVDDVIDISAVTFFGNLTVDVPEGVEVELTGFDVLGDRELRLTSAPRLPGMPLIRVKAYGILGDIDVRTPGRNENPPSWWDWFGGRRTGR